ncbi:hypothetical protein ACE1ET_20225 [Saccharicrinis sp. FJH62]|uniref:hypothetical protein n=1 Tax=Saccharicrinis sp. FJH62 TaxID=3344657 RepID=UPI0035D4A2A0
MKIKYTKLIVFLFLIAFILPSCRTYTDERLVFINNSDQPIYVRLCEYHNDTTYVYCVHDLTASPEKYKYEPFEKKVIQVPYTWENIFDKADSMTIYIFDAELFENTPLDSTANNYLILYRYDFTYDDLVNWTWEITYPKEKK